MPVIEPLRISGLRDFQAALKQMDGESQKQLRLVLNDSADIVAEGARRIVKRGKSGKAAASVKSMSSQREARVKGGSAGAPYYPWLDFGGRVGRKHSVLRPFIKTGRYIYPTYNARKLWIHQRLERGLTQLAKDAGMGVS